MTQFGLSSKATAFAQNSMAFGAEVAKDLENLDVGKIEKMKAKNADAAARDQLEKMRERLDYLEERDENEAAKAEVEYVMVNSVFCRECNLLMEGRGTLGGIGNNEF